MNAKAIRFLLAPVAVVAGYLAWPKPQATPPIAPGATVAPVSSAAPALAVAETPARPSMQPEPVALPPTEVVDLMDAIAGRMIRVEARGNGRDRMTVKVTNLTSGTLALRVPVAQVFEFDRNAVIALRPEGNDIPSKETAEISVQTAALRSTNKLGEQSYRPTYHTVPKLELLLTYVQDHLELSQGAIQTAVLALTENLPVSAVSKFTPAGGSLPSRFNTDAFRVATFDIIQALTALREVGVKDQDLALTIDPQLKIEAMIEPLCRAAAMRYYGIAEETEWEYWRAELLQGDPSTRHYALFGIARFYPDVALEMLPRWVRESKTNMVYRLAAVQALADTQKTEALPLLQTLTDELGADSELGKACAAAAKYLDSHLAKMSASRTKVAFRASANTF